LTRVIYGFDDATKFIADVLPRHDAVETGISVVNDAKYVREGPRGIAVVASR
jgi:hypothetical protein